MRAINLTKSDVLNEYQIEKKNGCYNDIFNKYKNDPAFQYCVQVLENQIITCNDIKLMAFRHLQDLRRVEEEPKNFPYYYDLRMAKAIVKFSGLLIDISTGNPLKLMDWQKSLMCMITAWKNKKDDSKRFNKVIFSVARTNGKTALCAILILFEYLVNSIDKTGQEIVLVAPNNTQATKGYSYLQLQANRLREYEAFDDIFKDNQIEVQADQIISKLSQNKVLKMSFESKRFDSLHPSLVIADEVADDTRSALIDEGIGKLSSGQGQTDAQMVLISTSYPDPNSFYHKQENMMRDTLNKDNERKLDNILMVNYTQDNLEKETFEPNTWYKSNPLLTLPKVGEKLFDNLKKERDTKEAEGKLFEFQNKNLNCWLNHHVDNYLELKDIENSVVDTKPIDIKGKQVYIGMDLSNFSDDTSIAFIYPYQDRGQNKFYIEQHSWIPTARSQGRIDLKEKQDNIPYRTLEQEGFCDIAENRFGYINYDEVFEWLLNYIDENELDVQSICYDNWRSDKLIKLIESNTPYRLIPLKQTVTYLNDTTKDFQRDITEGKITFLDDGIIKTALSNAILYQKEGLVKIDKNRATRKIDCADAIIDAYYRARLHFDNIEEIEKQSSHPFQNMTNKQINDIFDEDYTF